MFEDDSQEKRPKGPRVRALAPGISYFILVGVVCCILGPLLCQVGGSFNFLSDQLLGTHIGIYSSSSNKITILGWSAGPVLVILGPIALFYGIYESARSSILMSTGIRVKGNAEMVEENNWEEKDNQGNSTIKRIYYLNYRYRDQNHNVLLGQAKLDDELQGPVWKRLINGGKTTLEVVYNPAHPTEHVALFREPTEPLIM